VGDTLFISNSHAVSYLWNTGSSTSYINPGFSGWYIVTATNSFNCQKIDSCFVIIKGLKPNPTIIKNASCILQNNQYVGSSSGNIQQWIWHFNDTIIEGQIVYHTYPQTGIYPVTLTVVDSNSCYSSFSILDTVYPRPRTVFFAKEDCMPHSYVFEAFDTNSYPITNYAWHINQQVLYGNPITLNISSKCPVMLIVQDINNCRDTIIQYVDQFLLSNEAKRLKSYILPIIKTYLKHQSQFNVIILINSVN
jgi:hypothetical protein